VTPPTFTQLARTLRKQDTWAEKLLWSWLRDRRFSSYKFRRQHPYPPHGLDFFCLEAMLDIELDGGQHGTPEPRRKDSERDAWLEKRGIKKCCDFGTGGCFARSR
jgi:very-short-patch-repair endonuclease